MVSRDLTCNETMPPLDDGDHMIGMRNMRTNAAPIVQNNLNSSIPLIRNSNDAFQPTMIGSSRPSILNEIGQDESHITVREIVNRQIRNSKLKNEAEKLAMLTSKIPEFDGKIKKHNRHHTTTNGNGRLLTSGSTHRNQVTANRNEIIVPQSTTAITAEPIVVSLNHKNNNSSSIFNCHQIPIGQHLTTTIIQQPIYKDHVPQISNGHWAQHPPDSTTIQNQQQFQQYNNSAPKKVTTISSRTVLLPEPPAITATAPSKSSTTPTSIIVHQQTNNNNNKTFLLPTNDGLGVTKVVVVKEQQQQAQPKPTTPNNHHQNAATTPHSSPRPSILRNSMRRLVERPASASGICDSFGNGQSRILNCSSQGVEDTFGGEDSPRKKPRKQYFGETTQQQDKLMMEVYANLHGQQCTSNAGPTIIHQQSSNINDQPKTSTSHTSSITVPKKIQPMSKKRGRPKNNNKIPSSAHTSFKYVPEKAISTKAVHQTPSNLNLMSTGIVNGNVVQQSPRVMVDVDSFIQDSTVKKRKYKKREPETDPNTGEIIKKERKKGSGRKSKREEKAALQQKESAILAGIGITATAAATNNHRYNLMNSQPSTSSSVIPISPNYVQQNHQQQIDAREEDVIKALCRFRRDSEQQQQKEVIEKATTQKPSTSGVNVLEQKEKVNKQTTKVARKNELIALKESHFPLLSDMMKLMDGDLRASLKNCEKALDTEDNDHLLESYNELNNLLTASSSSTSSIVDNEFAINPFDAPAADKTRLDEICGRATCSVFDSYGQFKSSIDHLRMLPKAIGYFESSQRFLRSIRTNLLGHSFYQRQKATQNCFDRKVKKEEEAIRLVALPKIKLENGSEEGSNDKAEKLHRFIFEKISENWRDNTNDLVASEKLLLQLEVAETLDSVVDRVDRNQINSRKFIQSEKKIDCAKEEEMPQTSAQNSSSFDFIDSSLISNNTLKKVPKTYLELFQRGRKRKLRKIEKWNDKEENMKDDEEKDDEEEVMLINQNDDADEEEEIGDEIAEIKHWKTFLDNVGQICEMAQHNLDLLDRFQCKFIQLFEQLKEEENGGIKGKLSNAKLNMEFPKMDIQMKKNPHKSCQFLFRPPNAVIGELFKDIADLKKEKPPKTDGNAENEKVEKAPSTNEINGAQKSSIKEKQQPQCDDQPEMEETQSSTNMVLADLEELMDNSRHISTLALARLKAKYPEKFKGKRSERQYAKNLARKEFSGKLSEESIDDSTKQFKPSIQYSFPPDSAPDKQREFLKDQMREVQEVYKTAADLMQNRVEIAKECADCLQEIFNGKAECSRRSNSSNSADRKSEELMEHRRNCDTPESPSIPAKRKAHWRALSNIQSTSRAASISRGGSTEMMMDLG